MKIMPTYPTEIHETAATKIIEYFINIKPVQAVILTGSTTHGGATRDSCIDIFILLSHEDYSNKSETIMKNWEEYYSSQVEFKELLNVGAYSEVHLSITDGDFKPKPRGFTSGPDEFELEIGNIIAYGIPLLTKGNRFKELQRKWLPYYDEDLRKKRLDIVKKYCINNLEHVPLFVDRGLYFQAFNRFYDAIREFFQALFISRRKYPLAYDKWIRKQFYEILHEPKLYQEITNLMEINNFESNEIKEKAGRLRQLFDSMVAD